MFVPDMRPHEIVPPSREIYGEMGEANIFKMMADFYGELEQSAIRGMFPQNMEKASQKSATFFVGLLGGPPLYQERYGNPMMRGRHMSFAIDEAARKVWVACFEKVLENATNDYNFPADHLPGFRQFLDGFSRWMVNTA